MREHLKGYKALFENNHIYIVPIGDTKYMYTPANASDFSYK